MLYYTPRSRIVKRPLGFFFSRRLSDLEDFSAHSKLMQPIEAKAPPLDGMIAVRHEVAFRIAGRFGSRDEFVQLDNAQGFRLAPTVDALANATTADHATGTTVRLSEGNADELTFVLAPNHAGRFLFCDDSCHSCFPLVCRPLLNGSTVYRTIDYKQGEF